MEQEKSRVESHTALKHVQSAFFAWLDLLNVENARREAWERQFGTTVSICEANMALFDKFRNLLHGRIAFPGKEDEERDLRGISKSLHNIKHLYDNYENEARRCAEIIKKGADKYRETKQLDNIAKAFLDALSNPIRQIALPKTLMGTDESEE